MVDALDFRSPSREKVSHAGEITMKRHWETDELVEHWTLLPRETELLTNKTGATRLGFAVLLKFFQLEAYFPQQATDVPTVDDALRRRAIPLAWDRCALADSCGIDHHGHWKLLDVADEPRHQLVAGRLAALRGDWWAVDDLRPA
jgi:hypothetical protein